MRNRNGFSLFVVILMVAAISVLIATVVFSRSLSLAKVGKNYRHQVDSFQISHELAVIFANPKLCEGLVSVQGEKFKVAGIFMPPTNSYGTMIPLKGNPSVGIKAMTVTNITNAGGSEKSATFTIVTQEMHDQRGTTQKINSIKAIYTPDSSGSGGVKNCRIVISPEAACADLGFTWNETASRCGICEKMGGTWNSTACSLVSGAKKDTVNQ